MSISRRTVLALPLVAAASALAAGCSPAGNEPQNAQTQGSAVKLQVFAANSLSKALEEAQALYTQQTGVTFADTQYKGSGELVEMLAGGAYADLLIPASQGTMDSAAKRGQVDESTRTTLFSNDLVIVAREDAPFDEVSLEDIAAGRYSLAVGDESVPAGNYACQALSTVGAYVDPSGKTGAQISGKGGTFEGITPVLQTSVGNVCKQAQNGDVDVAIVYSSDVFRFGGVKIVGTIDPAAHKPISYPGAVTAMSERPQEALAFMQWCLDDPEAQRIWNEWGFELA